MATISDGPHELILEQSTCSFLTNVYQGRWTQPEHESKLTKNCYGMVEWIAGEELGKQPSPQTRSSGWLVGSIVL